MNETNEYEGYTAYKVIEPLLVVYSTKSKNPVMRAMEYKQAYEKWDGKAVSMSHGYVHLNNYVHLKELKPVFADKGKEYYSILLDGNHLLVTSRANEKAFSLNFGETQHYQKLSHLTPGMLCVVDLVHCNYSANFSHPRKILFAPQENMPTDINEFMRKSLVLGPNPFVYLGHGDWYSSSIHDFSYFVQEPSRSTFGYFYKVMVGERIGWIGYGDWLELKQYKLPNGL